MNDFLQSIRTRFGEPATLIAELWINFYLYGLNINPNEVANYTAFVKAQMRPLERFLGVQPALFQLIVDESRVFLQTHGQTMH